MDVLPNRHEENTRILFEADEGLRALEVLGALARSGAWDGSQLTEYRPVGDDGAVTEPGLQVTIPGVFGRRDIFRLVQDRPAPSTNEQVAEYIRDVHLPDVAV